MGRPKWKCNNVQKLINLYNLGWSLRKISTRYNVSTATIKNALLTENITIRTFEESIWLFSPDIERLKELYLGEKKSIQSIAKLFNVGYRATRNALIRTKIKLRDRNTKDLRRHNKESREKMRRSKLGVNNPMFGKKPSKKTLQTFEQNRKLSCSKEACKKRSRTRIEKGLSKGDKNPMKRVEVIKKWAKSNNLKPNKKEAILFDIINEYFPNRFNLNVTGGVIIGNKIPDFINVNKKEIIELFGNYWHRGENSQDKIDFFSRFGYKTLVIWERELENINNIIDRLYEFIERGQKNASSIH